ncbi:complex I subunit 5 family protein [Desulfurivibrio alkaliphilus]|uniref:NADH/Ubiquinone/plastoquinone (Complex I) n=1 Tax=Desulfurivibrio alkaliphilus (strain DSM 19089 / UNIQEM U267 / AHT2) TaxID=589865 RepID=D6Z734_DESAT|nr:proton-conducting transporter membrane subunit [Desulfurivibrio alkaliphilus]ADH87021.1 NADH/Ubiquinone/plastoquinone (complex I) [Desulfurivibrio alkaliphilus AHT 2]
MSNINAWLPLAILFSSFGVGVVIFFLREESVALRTTLNLGGSVSKLILIAILVRGLFAGVEYQAVLPLLPGINLVLRADSLAVFFATLSAVLWLLTTIYAVGYLENSPNRSRFFGFFSLCVSATVGVSLAGDLFTFLLFYEMLTLATYPLVVHRGTPEALAAGKVYLYYTVGGGALLLLGTAWLWSWGGDLAFGSGMIAAIAGESDRLTLQLIFVLLIAGLGVKAALVPLCGWLPVAMAAPAPVSALLHAVAVVKAGAFGIFRVVADLYGLELCQMLGVLPLLTILAAATIIYGSIRALQENSIKKRLAWSTVSQVSYIGLGVSLAGPLAVTGGLVHLVHQGLMKITLFFCAGNLAETLGIHRIDEMSGLGRRMPWTMAAFTIGALGMIGLPPMAGFFSKWYLGWGALEVGQPWILAILAISTLLNAAYFLPVVHRIWFKEPLLRPERERRATQAGHRRGGQEANNMLLIPSLITALLVIIAGLLAAAPASPLSWAKFIVGGGFP